MSFSQRLQEIRSGFEPPFWVANFTEIFERVAYYATTAVLAIYLTEQLHFSSELAGTILGIAGFVVYALAILAGTLADRFGFRRTLMVAYLLLTVGYFLLGSLESAWMAPLEPIHKLPQRGAQAQLLQNRRAQCGNQPAHFENGAFG